MPCWRAVWLGWETFAGVYAWTHDHMIPPRPPVGLALGAGCRTAPGASLDANTASDGDLDYALALAAGGPAGLAAAAGPAGLSGRGPGGADRHSGKEVVALPDGARLLTPGNWHEAAPPYLLNPSYFSPAAYRAVRSNWRHVL